MLANYAMVIVSVALLKRTFPISLTTFLPLLLLNPTTTTSILCVNKEVVDLLVLSLFLFARTKHHSWMLPFVLVLAFMNRWETCSVLIVYMFLSSRLNPLRRRRWTTVFVLILALNFVMPYLGAKLLTQKFEEVESGNTVVWLDKLQLNYMFVIAVIPKILDNLFGQLLNHQVWEIGSSWLIINLFNNLAYAILMVIGFVKRVFTVQNDIFYLAVIGSVIMAQSLAIQPRYFYFVYVLLCLQIALKEPTLSTDSVHLRSSQPKLAHA